MTHLGDRVTDLVDGQLGPVATESAHAHLAGCMSCREAVEAERLTKSRLAGLGSPAISGDLMARLLAVGGASPDQADPDPDGALIRTDPGGRVIRTPAGTGVPGRPTSVRPAGSRAPVRPAGSRPAGRLRTRRTGLAAAVIGALSVVGVGAAAGLTMSTGISPAVVLPPVATFVVERTATDREFPFVPASWLGRDREEPAAVDPGTP